MKKKKVIKWNQKLVDWLRIAVMVIGNKLTSGWWLSWICERLKVTEIGIFSGNVSSLEKAYAQRRGYKPLCPWERWLIGGKKEVERFVEEERKRRREIWRQVCIQQLGEDPFDPIEGLERELLMQSDLLNQACY